MARTRPSTAPALDRDAIERRALAYLDRFDASAARLRARLLQAVRRQCADPAALEEARAIVDELVTRYQANGILDDARYARSLAHNLRARGASLRGIRQRLLSRGVAPDVLNRVLTAVAAEHPEEQAAREFVRRRRIGPWRAPGDRSGAARRDFAALARAGFDADVARRALDVRAEDED